MHGLHRQMQLQTSWHSQEDLFDIQRDSSPLVALYRSHIAAALDRHASDSWFEKFLLPHGLQMQLQTSWPSQEDLFETQRDSSPLVDLYRNHIASALD